MFANEKIGCKSQGASLLTMDLENVIFIYNGILLNHKKE
jgi:hypothetical protein